MLSDSFYRRIIRRVVSAILVVTCLVASSDLSLAKEAILAQREMLAPASRLNPLARLEPREDGTYEIVTDEAAMMDFRGEFAADL